MASGVPRLRSFLIALMALACAERPDAQSPGLSRPGVVTPQASVALVVAAAVPVVAVEPAEPEPVAPTPETAPEPSIVLAAGGDVNFGRECGQAILHDRAYDPFTGLGPAWTSADLRFVNLESQLSDQKGVTQHPGNRLIFTGPPGGADVLARAGVSLVSTANNHAWDYGKSALFETIANLKRAGVPFAGTGADQDAAYAPVVLHVKQRSIALFAVTQIWNPGQFSTHEGRHYVAWANVARLRPLIERARHDYDFVLVSYHGGAEYVHAPPTAVRQFLAAMMALGVDAVIGHHPHVPHGIGFCEGRPIIYSLGNFVFAGHDVKPWTKSTFFARLTLRKGTAPLLDACPIAIDGHRPRSYDTERERLAIERVRLHVVDTSASVGGANVAHADELGCLRVTPLATADTAQAP
jgi:poly-gamma-glutamate synthesis protein (capsule biosynthesis protein)